MVKRIEKGLILTANNDNGFMEMTGCVTKLKYRQCLHQCSNMTINGEAAISITQIECLSYIIHSPTS